MENLERMQDRSLDPVPHVAEEVAQGVGNIIDYKRIIEEAQVPMYDESTTMAIRSTAEKSLAGTEIISVGSLSEIAPDAKFVGSISLKNKLESGSITQKELEKTKAILTECYVPVSKGLPMRCGDGRGEEGTEELGFIELLQRELGTQAMGASQTHAMANRMVSDPSDEVTLEKDLMDIRASIVEAESEIGLHTDTHQHEPGKTGCGAVNGTESGVSAYNNDVDNGATQLARAVVGEKYSDSAHASHKAKASKVPASYASDNVNLTNHMTDIGDRSKQVYAGNHEELLLAINNVQGTTLNRELFIRRCKEEIGKVIQVFGVDAWHFGVVAEKRFPADEQKQTEYVTACADWQARPALSLTDGTVEVVVRVPSGQVAVLA